MYNIGMDEILAALPIMLTLAAIMITIISLAMIGVYYAFKDTHKEKLEKNKKILAIDKKNKEKSEENP